MKQVADSIAQFFAIIMIMVTLAVSTAAVAQWAEGGAGSAQRGGAIASGAQP